MSSYVYILFTVLCVCSSLIGCGDEETAEGEGDVQVAVYGEEFIEEGIPASEMGDGWAVTFDRFVVTVGDVRVAGVSLPSADPVDIAPSTQGAGHILASIAVPSGTHTNSEYTISRVDVAGSATKDGVVKTFAWVFDEPTQYTRCETSTNVEEGAQATFQITVHADHLFYDSLVSEDPNVLFQAIADADVDGDGVVAQEELAATGIGSYDPGSTGEADNMWSWLVAQHHTLGHVDGEGHCDAEVLSN